VIFPALVRTYAVNIFCFSDRGIDLIGHRLRGVSNQFRVPWKIRFLKSLASYYDEVRTHLSLGREAPLFRPAKQIAMIPILGGLHHQYVRI
jgi:hypothetical protein